MTLTEALSAHAAQTRYADLPREVTDVAVGLIRDSIGVAIAGAAHPSSQRLRGLADYWGVSSESRIWGTSRRSSAPVAAMTVAHQMHCFEFDCIHEPAVVHPLTVVLPSLIAAIERDSGGVSLTGRDLITAAVVGVDVAAGIGDVVTTPLQFFRPGTAGIFGAICAIGNALRLPERTISNAIGIGYGQVSGTMQPHVEGSDLLPLQVGFNARNALVAVDLAVAGQEGPRHTFEGPYGYYRLIEAGGTPDKLEASLGRMWEVTRVSYKPFPSGRATHAAIDGMLRLRRSGVDPSTIDRIVCRVPPMIHQLVNRPLEPSQTPGAARLNLAFLAASAILDGRVDLSTTALDRLSDPTVHELARKVEILIDDNPNPNAFDPQTFEIHAAGRVESVTVDYSLGSPGHSLDPDEQIAKFQSCVEFGTDWESGRIEALAAVLSDLANEPSLDTMLSML